MDDHRELNLPERLAHIADYVPKDRCVRCGDLSEMPRALGSDGQMSLEGPFCRRCVAYYRYLHDPRYRAKIRANRRRYEAVERGATPPGVSFTLEEIAERDDWTCQLCRDPVDPAADRNGPDGASIDHIVPLSRGGSHEPSNAQLAHRGCNSRKSNRLPGERWPRYGSDRCGRYVVGRRQERQARQLIQIVTFARDPALCEVTPVWR